MTQVFSPEQRALFTRAWTEAGGKEGFSLALERLQDAYNEPHRAYHTVQHISECLRWVTAHSGPAAPSAELVLALFFHDAIYDPASRSNELNSAKLFEQMARAASLDPISSQRTIQLILATAHDTPSTEPEAQWLQDIDLAILGATWPRFQQYESQIRQEYQAVPEPLYEEGRARALRCFLSRPRLYATDTFHSRLEEIARANLSRALAKPSRKD